MLTSRNYVVTDVTLAGLIQRNAKTLSFYSLIVEVTRRLIAFDDEATHITFHNMNGEHGPGGLMEAVHEMMNRHLGPGPGLDAVTAVQMEHTAAMLNSGVPIDADVMVDLYAWLRHLFSICNAKAIYGPENIFAVHPELEREFWSFEDGMLGLVIDVLPWITARKAFKARKRVLEGLVEYVKEERYKKASGLIQERVETNLAFGMSKEMAGHAELILFFGILGNAVPSLYWLIGNIFARPDVLRRIREEVQGSGIIESASSYTTSTQSDLDILQGKGTARVMVLAKSIVKSCPLLYSCYRETLRDISLLTSARLVLEDTVVADKYLLRKGSTVQIAGGVIHHDKIWGDDAGGFNPDRFLLSPEYDEKGGQEPNQAKQKAAPLPRGVPSAAFRAFGGGTVICPGRHFAQSELMTLAAVLAIGFDITELDGQTLRLPERDDTRVPLAVLRPVRDPKVRIRRRSGWEDVQWDITV